MSAWVSPDGKIKKETLKRGTRGIKPYEGSRCTITITDSPLLEEFTNRVVTIGDSDGELWNTIDICLSTMFEGEISKFDLYLNDSTISLVIELVSLVFDGFIHEWDARKKYDLSIYHKEKGKDFFNSKNNKEAALRFTKALKIVSSIPVDVEKKDIETIGGVKLADINTLKGYLYNNLASCYFRGRVWYMVKELCKKVLTIDGTNVKALYKLAVAFENERNFEKAEEILMKALEVDPENKACTELLGAVKRELKKAEVKVNIMIKKMFGSAIES